jgi:hypothetical protein
LQKLPRQLFRRNPQLGGLPCKLALKLRRGHAELTGKLLGGQARLRLLGKVLRYKLLC